MDGLAPLGAWAAITDTLPWEAWALGGAVALWVAGFDLLYALFDLEWTARRGCTRGRRASASPAAFVGARACHARTVLLLVLAGLGLPVGAFYWIGRAAVAALLAYEHSLVAPRDWKRLDMAFFTMNGVISVTFFAFVLLDATL